MPLTARLVRQLLRSNAGALYTLVGTSQAQFSVPTDGRGARIRVAVPSEYRDRVPPHVTLTYEGQRVDVPIEVDSEFDPIVLH